MIGKKAHRVGEETEDQAHEEVRNLLFGWAVRGGRAFEFEALCEFEEIGCRGLRDACRGDVWTQLVVIAEEVTQDIEWWKSGCGGVAGVQQVVEREGVGARWEILELGVDFEMDEIADDEERRVLQRFVVFVELFVGFL